MRERVTKILAAYGVASRRAAEQLILERRVTVNGTVISTGDKADALTDSICVDQQPIGCKPAPVYLMLHKPKGFVCTLSDERGRKNVTALLCGLPERVVPVGRLDINSEGLLLMTNDGALVHRLTHPSFSVEKIYTVWVRGDVENALPLLSKPMTIEGYVISPAQVRLLEHTENGGVLSVAIREGRNRQVRRMCEQTGLYVTRLLRVSEGDLRLGSLKCGKWRFLSALEIAHLQSLGKTQRPKKEASGKDI